MTRPADDPLFPTMVVGSLPQPQGVVEVIRQRTRGQIDAEEADRLLGRMKTFGDALIYHGRVDQPRLAELMRGCKVFALPSFYEGLPLVLVEALACGCQPVCTALPGVRSGIIPHLPGVLHTVELPEMEKIDQKSCPYL